MLPVAGLLSLVWFLIRVVPKPSRAAYPCQRAAAPLAGGFALWLAATLASASLFHHGKKFWKRSRTVLATACLAAAAALAVGALISMPKQVATAEPNQPIGIGKGIHPGRVVWARDPEATKWKGPGQGHWWEEGQTSQTAVDRMMSESIQRLTGETGDRQAWNALFRNFNQTHGRGNAAYRAGEKIGIKVNFVGCIFTGREVDPATYDFSGKRQDYMNTSPQMIRALLRQLVRSAGVKPEDISVGDPLALFPNQYHDLLHGEFPGVGYVDHNGGAAGHPRTRPEPSKTPLYWSSRPEGVAQDYVPAHYADATYLINLANLKGHTGAGVTLTAKNHYGSLNRIPNQQGYFDMHAVFPKRTPGSGQYRLIVDLMGHAHIGGKTLIYFIDSLYTGVHGKDASPRKMSLPPFNGGWAASLLTSQDPVAIDSVGFDFLSAELDEPRQPDVDDYLHEAALAEAPPSKTFYDPNHAAATVRLGSLGVHEHWNSTRDRQYSRNLGKQQGIELVQVGVVKQAQ
jgi:hypothetical protein